MDVEHEVLQVGVDTGLVVHCGLLIRQQVVKLYNADCYGLVFLGAHHLVFQDWVLDNLQSHNRGELASFSDIPPVVTVEGCVQVVP